MKTMKRRDSSPAAQNDGVRHIFAAIVALLIAVAAWQVAWAGASPQTAWAASSDDNALSALGIDSTVAPEGYDENSRSNPYGKETVTLNPVGEIYAVGLSGTTSASFIEEYDRILDTKNKNTTKKTETLSRALQGELFGHNAGTDEDVLASGDKQTLVSETNNSLKFDFTYKYMDYTFDGGYCYGILQNHSISTSSGDGYMLTSVAAGNFDGNTEGKEAQAAMLYTTALSKNGGLYLKIGDMQSGSYGDAIELISKSKAIGNPNLKINGQTAEDFATMPYLLQNYMQISTGDYDNDGIDEIAVYIPDASGSRIEVYKLKNTSGTANDKYKEASEWQIAWTYSLKETNYVSNMVSLLSGDFNQDGTDDLAATWGYYYLSGERKSSTAVVMFGAAGAMLQQSQEFSLKYDGSDIVRGAFAFGDISGGGEDTLVLGGQLASDIDSGNLKSRFVATYSWNGEQFVQTYAQNCDIFQKEEDGDYVYYDIVRWHLDPYTTNEGTFVDENYWSAPVCAANVEVVENGLGEAASVYLDSLYFNYSDSGLEFTSMLDQTYTFQGYSGGQDYYAEYGAATSDLDGSGKETFVTLVQTLVSADSARLVCNDVEGTSKDNWTDLPGKRYYLNWVDELLGRDQAREHTLTSTKIDGKYYPEETLPSYEVGATYRVEFGNNVGTYNNGRRTEVDWSYSFCVANTDADTTYMTYEGKYFTYSDPQVLAVLASPPYYADLLNRDDLSGNYNESTTSYGQSSGSTSGSTQTHTFSIGTYVSYEKDIMFFNTKIGSTSFQTEIMANMTWEHENTKSVEQTITYSARAGQDTVVMYSLPLEVYQYISYVPTTDENGNTTYEEVKTTVTVPHEACVAKLPLDSYESIADDYPALPQISGTVLTHTIGDPTSYPSSSNGYDVLGIFEGDPQNVGYSSTVGGASTTEEITVSYERSSSFTATASIDTSAGGGFLGWEVGVVAGYEGGAGTVTISTEGSTFRGEMQAMPAEAEEYGYYYNWRLFAYSGTAEVGDESYSFPVVSYIVSDVNTPPTLPTDFAQDVEATTSDSLTLTWTYDKSIAGFQLYRYYEFLDGAGSYELDFVSMSEGVYDAATGTYSFSYTDEGLSPYEEYDYQIQAVRASVPNNSIPSETLTARTKTAKGYPDIALVGLDADGALKIYPDSSSTVVANVNNIADYIVDSKVNLSYQWQADRGSGWENLSGKTSKSLTFASSGSADAGVYRCRINAIYYDEVGGDTYYITSYSDVFDVVYSKRSAVVGADGEGNALFSAAGVTQSVSGSKTTYGLELSLSLVSDHANHATMPTGNITFHVEGADYDADYVVGIDTTSTLTNTDGKYLGTASTTIDNMPEGMYWVTASYGGDRVFKGLEVTDELLVVVGNGEGYILNIYNQDGKRGTNFVYGEMLTFELKKVTAATVANPETVTENVEFRAYEYKTTISGWSSIWMDGATTKEAPGATANMRRSSSVNALIDGVVVATAEFTVEKRPLTVYVEDTTVSAGLASTPEVKLDESTPMDGTKPIQYCDIDVTAYNSAGNEVELNENTLPGSYTVTPGPGSLAYLWNKNYDITYISGTYTVTSAAYDVSCEVLADENGEVNGEVSLSNEGTAFPSSTALLFYAAPYMGYEVDTWTAIPLDAQGNPKENATQATQAGGTTFAYTMKDEPLKVTVSFKKSETTLSATAGEGGSIRMPLFFTSGAEVAEGAEFTFTAVPDEGYYFTNWMQVTGGTVTTYPAGTANDDSTNALTIEMPSRQVSLYAYFARESYTLTLGDNLEAVYKYDDDGMSSTPDVEKVVGSGAVLPGDTQVTVRVKTGYHVDEQAAWTAPESAVLADDKQSVTFAMTSDTEVSVATVHDSYTVSAGASGGVGGTVELSGIEAGDAVPGGASFTATAVEEYGYAFDHWTVNGIAVSETEGAVDNVLTVGALAGNMQIEAVFTKRELHNVSVWESPAGRASMSYTLVSASGETMIEDAAWPTTRLIGVYEGDTLTITVAPENGFMVGRWEVNGIIEDNRNKSRTFSNISEEISATVSIISSTTYKVSYDSANIAATADGAAFESGSKLGGGTALEFAAQVPSGKMVKGWTINGEALTEERVAELGLTMEHYLGSTIKVGGLSQSMTVGVEFCDYAGFDLPAETSGSAGTGAGEGGSGSGEGGEGGSSGEGGTALNYSIKDVTRTPTDTTPDTQVREGGDVSFNIAANVAEGAVTTFTTIEVNGYDCIAGTATDSGIKGCTSVTATLNADGSYTVLVKGVSAKIDCRIYTVTVTLTLDSYQVSDDLKTGLGLDADATNDEGLTAVNDALDGAADAALEGATDSISLDVALSYVDATGNLVTVTDPADFPEEGIHVSIPYASLGEGLSKFDTFSVIHLIAAGENAGQTEAIIPVNGEEALEFTVKTLSPFKVSWVKYVPVQGDETALDEIIAVAQGAVDLAIVSADGKDVDSVNTWVTQEALDALKTAIEVAQAVKSQTVATQEELDTAAAALRKATSAFDAAKQTGLKLPGQEDDNSRVRRLSGQSALDTMADIVAVGWADGSCEAVVLATSDGYWDALSANGLAGLLDCPVLITSGSSLSDQTASEIVRLGAKTVYIVGGETALAPAVETQIQGLGVATDRVAGVDAEGTAVAVFEKGKDIGSGWSTSVIVATADSYHDALAAAPYSYWAHAPIFLADAESKILDDSVAAAIGQGGFSQALVCGGTSAIYTYAEAQLSQAGVGDVVRKGGQLAVETSSAIAAWCLEQGMSAANISVATSEGYWDALTGAALCGKLGSPLVLANDNNRSTITGLVASNQASVSCAYIFGGHSAVSADTYATLSSMLP